MATRPQASDHEEFCRKHFNSWLERRVAPATIAWSLGEDPPDYLLAIGGIRRAVEVSRIVDGKTRTISASLYRLVEELEAELRGRGTLNGTFDVSLEESLPKGARNRRDFCDLIRVALQSEGPEVSQFRKEINVGGRRVAYLEKISATGSLLTCSGIGGGGWEDEIRAEYTALVSDLLRRKASRLAPHGPAVLLLQDSVCPISPRLLASVLEATPEVKGFEAIYVIRTETIGDLVHGPSDWPAQIT